MQFNTLVGVRLSKYSLIKKLIIIKNVNRLFKLCFKSISYECILGIYIIENYMLI